MDPIIKICGISDAAMLRAAADAGATHAGFVFYARSPRAVDGETARRLRAGAPASLIRVALLVDPDDAALEAARAALEPGLIQLHGAETAERVAQIRARSGVPVMKALGVSGPGDLARAAAFDAADLILLDAKPAPGGLPGGNGRAFDWALLQGFAPRRPWVLSGGLDPSNVRAAIAAARPGGVDVSSGVERAPGEKDAGLIAAFIAAAAPALARSRSARNEDLARP